MSGYKNRSYSPSVYRCGNCFSLSQAKQKPGTHFTWMLYVFLITRHVESDCKITSSNCFAENLTPVATSIRLAPRLFPGRNWQARFRYFAVRKCNQHLHTIDSTTLLAAHHHNRRSNILGALNHNILSVIWFGINRYTNHRHLSRLPYWLQRKLHLWL